VLEQVSNRTRCKAIHHPQHRATLVCYSVNRKKRGRIYAKLAVEKVTRTFEIIVACYLDEWQETHCLNFPILAPPATCINRLAGDCETRVGLAEYGEREDKVLIFESDILRANAGWMRDCDWRGKTFGTCSGCAIAYGER
jgi:hypothetical protein